MIVCIHWRRRHLTSERCDALRATLEEIPGPDRVEVEVTGTGQRLDLGMNVDASRSDLRKRISNATEGSGMSHVLDPETAFQ